MLKSHGSNMFGTACGHESLFVPGNLAVNFLTGCKLKAREFSSEIDVATFIARNWP